MMGDAIQAVGLSKRYRRAWALRDCDVAIPRGRVVALVGPNGAGKSTLLQLSAGLIKASSGSVRVLGRDPVLMEGDLLPRVGFLAQDRPLYKRFTVSEMFEMGRRLNPRWDQAYALRRLNHLGIPLDKRVGKLSGGQAAQIALVMTLAKRPELLLLDEPVAALDPLARREFLQVLMEAAADGDMTIVLSSHIIGDLERVCDFAVVLADSQLRLTGDIDTILDSHRILVGPRRDDDAVAAVHNVVEAIHTNRQSSLLVRINGCLFDNSWSIHTVGLEEVVFAYLSREHTVHPLERPVASR